MSAEQQVPLGLSSWQRLRGRRAVAGVDVPSVRAPARDGPDDGAARNAVAIADDFVCGIGRIGFVDIGPISIRCG
jgi:hypothetical protein